MLLSFSWQASPQLSSKYYLGWHIQNLLHAVFFAKLIVGFIYDHMAASHVLLKWFACKMEKTYFYSHEETGKKNFKSQNKILKAQRNLSHWHVGCTNLETVSRYKPMSVEWGSETSALLYPCSSSWITDGSNHSDSILWHCIATNAMRQWSFFLN